MGIENLSRWQWMVLGLLAGLALAFLNQLSKPGDDGWDGRTVGQMRFERLAKEAPIVGHPVIRNVRLFPSDISPATGKKVAVVAFDELIQVGNTEVWNYEPTRYLVTEPVKPLYGNRSGDGMTARAYLEGLSKEGNANWQFRYAWWSEPRNAYLLWGAAGVLVIGGVWPTLQNLLIGAGLGRPRQPKEKKVKLSKIKPMPAVAPVAVVQTNSALEELNASLEKDLEAAGVLSTPSYDPEDSTAGAPAIPVLNAGPLDGPKDAEPDPTIKPSDNYRGGVFYPVATKPVKRD